MTSETSKQQPPFADLRVEYRRGRLHEADLDSDPLLTFAAWFEEANQANLREANGMTLATVGPDGHPSARIVLLKGVDPRGFSFYTNYASRKGEELAANPWAALVFWWATLERQVRVEGMVERLTEAESDDYYQSRPKGAQLGAWVSAQSQTISDRQMLTDRLAELEAQYATASPPRPPHWGGYRLIPTAIEFWQGGLHRLHDRLRYVRPEAAARRGENSWQVERLAP